MKICVVQTRPVKGDIQLNIANHKKLIGLAIEKGAGRIIFPELSITGYEPELAKDLATNIDDSRFDEFQNISDESDVTIGIGMPVKKDSGICIGMILFQPAKPRQVYYKKYIHADEEPFFICGENENAVMNDKDKIALAICYELSIPAHAESAFKQRAKYYIASAAKSKDAMERTYNRLSEIARRYSMIVFLSNCVGESGGYDCGGKSAIWNSRGLLLAQLNETDEGILIFDTSTNEIVKEQFSGRVSI